MHVMDIENLIAIFCLISVFAPAKHAHLQARNKIEKLTALSK